MTEALDRAVAAFTADLDRQEAIFLRRWSAHVAKYGPGALRSSDLPNDKTSAILTNDNVAEVEMGSSKSGNRGHAGRPGKVGGSGPSKFILHQATPEMQQKVEKAVKEEIARIGDDPAEIERVCLDNLEEVLRNSLAVRRSTHAAEHILEDGRFKTQFETGSSGGFYDPMVRTDAEEEGLGIPRDIPVAERPVYGFVAIPGESTATSYGDIEFRLKDSVKDRSTITAGDSLGVFGDSAIGTPVRKPGIGCLDRNVAAIRLRRWDWLGYIEAQIQGGLRTSDIDHVIVHDYGGFGRKRGDFTGLEERLKAAKIGFEYDSN